MIEAVRRKARQGEARDGMHVKCGVSFSATRVTPRDVIDEEAGDEPT